VQNIISNFSQIGHYPNYLYDSGIYLDPYLPFYSNNTIYQQSNPAVQSCHTYNFFGGGSSTYQESSFEDNCSILGANLNLNEFDGNLSLGRTEEPSAISDGSNISFAASKVILIHIVEYSDDQEEEDNRGQHYLMK
jgi:hypothetical protein